ncbi:restriction endonuclease subunit S [Sulfitobacter faviae]|uniref:Restriction endonuclease subunit S n=1 Tax=Sulfitobacter faviae TaxID=1775881 RepID=A0AAX3LL80_9RHOB|nr:restriction endonuclease subunit S [Sulfitobacter faviae]WCE69481.1 restriction endonuclease subunit S [Sulfitobacter faviae]
MNAERLLEVYEQISEAPDAIARLRRFVLDLAVRGKLVEQDVSEVPEQVGLEPHTIDAPYELPANWRWMRIGDQLNLLNGMAFKPTDWISEGLRIVRIQNLNNPDAPHNLCDPAMARDRSLIDNGSFLISWSGTPGTSFGAFIWDRGPAVLNQHIFRCDFQTDAYTPEFLKLAINGRLDEMIEKAHGGVGLRHITKGKLQAMLIAVPPFAEQHRIVTKVDELIALCDRLEKARKTREELRDKLTAASLARLTAPDTTTEDFLTHAAFALEALPALTTRPDQIKTLRQTILNLAVRGKLVEQDPADEPGHDLLDQTRHRAEILRKDAGVRKKKAVAPLDGIDDMGLPEKWSADAFANVIDPRATISYGVLVPGPDVDDGVPFVRAQDLMLSGHPDKPGKVIAHDIESKYARTRLEGGEILLCVVGSIGKLGVAPKKWAGANIARAVARISPMEEISREFTLLFLRSDLAQTYFNEATRTLAQPTLNVGLIEKLPFPIPPLAEQHRIVAKVDALMALCDRLEAALTTADTTRTRLLESLLHEALEPAANALEAAE